MSEYCIGPRQLLFLARLLDQHLSDFLDLFAHGLSKDHGRQVILGPVRTIEVDKAT